MMIEQLATWTDWVRFTTGKGLLQLGGWIMSLHRWVEPYPYMIQHRKDDNGNPAFWINEEQIKQYNIRKERYIRLVKKSEAVDKNLENKEEINDDSDIFPIL